MYACIYLLIDQLIDRLIMYIVFYLPLYLQIRKGSQISIEMFVSHYVIAGN